MILPIVHMNGTSRSTLIQLRCDAAAPLRDALKALSEMAPNGRDYYPVPGHLTKAQAQHDRRVAALRTVYDEIEAEAEALALDGV